MGFRLLVIGGKQRFEYGRLRAALDVLLVNRLPDVEILTAGGPGTPALAACYARERGLPLLALPVDHTHHCGDAADWRDARLVQLTDAAVLVGDAIEVRGLLERAMVKGIRVVTLNYEPRKQGEQGEPAPLPQYRLMVRGLPD